ncbi:MAG: hypothetical protein FWH01_05835 [Oscillospiraceae bacterium]|nr:hypothetical protein [Oscillospiraceae bacterium]
MKQFAIRATYLIVGIILFAVGLVLTIRANIGYAPWEVFHSGLGLAVGISIGDASIIAGVIIVIIVTACGEKIGLGTVFSMILTGVFLDELLKLDIVPLAPNMPIGILMLVAGMFVIAAGTYYYIKSAFGAGPRDNLMVVLNKKTKMPVGLCRGIVELVVTFVGWLLGGMVGVGTVITVVAIGFCVQIVFAVFKFDAAAVEHETLAQTYKALIAGAKRGI